MTKDLSPTLFMSKSSSFRHPIKSISSKLSKLTGKGSRKAKQDAVYQDSDDDMDASVVASKKRIESARRRYAGGRMGQQPLDDESENSVQSSIYSSVMMDDMSEMSSRSERVAAATAKYGSLLMDEQSEKSTYSLLDKLEDARENTKKKKKKSREPTSRLSKSLDLQLTLDKLNDKMAAQEKSSEGKRKVTFQKKLGFCDGLEDPGDWNDIFYSPAEIKKLKEEADELKKQATDGKTLDKNVSLRGLESKDPMAVSSFVAKVLDLQEQIWDASGHSGKKKLKHSDPDGIRDLASIMSHQACEDARKRGRRDETDSKKVYAAMRKNKDEKKYLVEPRSTSPVREVLRTLSSHTPERKEIKDKVNKKEAINRTKSLPLDKRQGVPTEKDTANLEEENHDDAEVSKHGRRRRKSRSRSPRKSLRSRKESKAEKHSPLKSPSSSPKKSEDSSPKRSPSSSPKKSLSPKDSPKKSPPRRSPSKNSSKSPSTLHLKLVHEDADYRSLTMQERIARDKARLEERRKESEMLRRRRVMKEARRMKQEERDEKTRETEKAKKRKERKLEEQRKKDAEEDRRRQEQAYLTKEEQIAEDKRKKKESQLRNGRRSRKPGTSKRTPRSLSPKAKSVSRESEPMAATPLNDIVAMGGSIGELMADESFLSISSTASGSRKKSRMGRRYRKKPVRRAQSDAAAFTGRNVGIDEMNSDSDEEHDLEQFEDFEEDL